MQRREFIGILASTSIAWPLVASAQQVRKVPLIGVLATGAPAGEDPRFRVLKRRLQELGWIDGQTAKLEIRFGDGRRERADEIAAEFAQLKADVIVTAGAVGILAAKRAMPTTPVVFAITADPVGAGLVDSLAHPGGTITGLSSQGPDYGGKQIDLLREIVPNLHHVGVIANAASPGALAEMRGFETAAKALGLDVLRFEVRAPEDITPAFEAMQGKLDALDVVPDPFATSNRQQIMALALAAGIPAIYGTHEWSEAGGLMSFGPHLPDLYRRAAELVDKILRGAKPAEIPIEQPTKFELVINLKTAKAMGLTIPETFLARADEVIE
jgi:putative ABC transport system substrate-binding protein